MATPQLFSSPPLRRFSPPSGGVLNRQEIRSFQDSTDLSSVIRNSRFLKVRQISVFANRSSGMKVSRAIFGERRYLFSSSLLLSAHLESHNVSSAPVFSSNSGGRHPQPGLFPLTGREEGKRQHPNVPYDSLSQWQEEIKRVIHSKLLHQVHCHAGNARMTYENYENTQNDTLVRENYQFENAKDPNEDREWLLPTKNSHLRGCDVIFKQGGMPKSFNQKSRDYNVDKQQYRASHLMVSSENVGVRSSMPIHSNHVKTAITNQHPKEDILTLEPSLDDVGAKGFKSNGSVVQWIVTEIEKDDSKWVGAGIASGRESAITGSSVENNYVNSEPKKKLIALCDKVLIVNNIPTARRVVEKLTTKYKHLIHACDTEVSKIDVKEESPVYHGEIICFSIYSGSEADFDGKSYIWVDILDGGRDLLNEFAPFFEDPSIKKVWHNYSFDSHVIENYGLKVAGFHADTMHLARLWDSSRRTEGGYSLEALSGDPKVMSKSPYSKKDDFLSGKISMKSLFGRKKLKKDGSEGKLLYISPVEELQREEREAWIGYSVLDSKSTLDLYESLKAKLERRAWNLDGKSKGTMFDFYEEYWRPFGELLVKMESEGMLVDRAYLAEIEQVATKEQQIAADKFRKWASTYCSDAKYMNVGSDTQLRQLFFGGMVNRKDPNEFLPDTKTFKVPNVDKVIEEGKKSPSKYRNIELKKIGSQMETEIYTATGWPSVSVDALKALAGNVSPDVCEIQSKESIDQVGETKCSSSYGTAFDAFGGNGEGLEACCAITALCEVCSIDSLISNFILPLQSDQISGKNGRIHCSLNINTETGRLSARRPNLQNQPALEKDRYKIRQGFIAEPGNSLIVADYGQLELRILAHLADCRSMLEAFKAGGDFHSRTAMNMYPHIQEAVEEKRVLLEWHPQPGEEKPPVPLLKDAFASERRKAKMLNFSIAYGKTPMGLARDWKVSVKEAKGTVDLWYKERQEVLKWQDLRKEEAQTKRCVYTLLGRARHFPSMASASYSQKAHIERAAINTPVQGSAADVAMCAMLEISRNARLKELKWRLLLQVHDEVILEGPTESAEEAKAIVVECMSKPFYGTNFLKVDLAVDVKCAQNWYAAK